MPSYGLTSGDIVEIRWNATLFNQAVMFGTHYQAGSGSPAPTDLQALMESWAEVIWTDALQVILSEDVEACFLEGQVIAPTRLVGHSLALVPTTGESTDPALPPSTAVVFSKATLQAGPAYRGRNYIPGVPFIATEAGQVIPANLPGYQEVADQFAEALDFNGRAATPVLYSIKSSVVRGNINTVTATGILRNQRRRQIGKGQ